MADLDQEIDRLYALPLGEFIGARNELAKRLKAGGDGEAAARVKGLAKPSVTAWAVNALYHHERERFDALLSAAVAVRAALAGKGDRKQAEAARREALRGLLGRAAKILAEAGHAATPANRQRINHTLETLAARDPEAESPPPGRLAADLEPQGFDVLAGLAASLPPAATPAGPSRARSGKRAAKAAAGSSAGKSTGKAAGKAAVRAEAVTAAPAAPDERLLAARRAVEEQEAELTGLEREANAAEAAAGEAKERHERLTVEAVEAERLARAAAKALAAAKTELAAANKTASAARTARRRSRSRLATARRKLERLEG